MSFPTNYLQYRDIILTNSASTSFDDFQLIFNVHRESGTDSGFDIYLGTNIKEDYSDIIFTLSDHSTIINHYLIVPYTSSVAKVLVKIPNIDASSSVTISIFYNNPTAVSTSNKDATVVPAITNSSCESTTGWTRYEYTGVTSFQTHNSYHTEGSWSIRATVTQTGQGYAHHEIGQTVTLEVGTPYKIIYDCQLYVYKGAWSTIQGASTKINDVTLQSHSTSSAGTYTYPGEVIQFTPTTESVKISWDVFVWMGSPWYSPYTYYYLDNIILMKDITSVTVSEYGDTEYCVQIYDNDIVLASVNSVYMPLTVQIDIDNVIELDSDSYSCVPVRNGGFETGNFESYNDVVAYDGEIELFDVWTVAASAKQTGTFGAQCDIDAGEYAYMYKPLVITAEQTTLGIWFRMPTCDISGEGYIALTIQLLNSGYDYVDTLFDDIFVAGTSSFEWAAATCDVSLYSGDFILYTRIHSITGGGGVE
ncbi:MAG: DUF2341 domain-containing protein [Candidatus Paceibacterota bacterium]